VRQEPDSRDQELVSLAQETRRVAAAFAEGAMRARLIEIADEMLDLAGCREQSN
jgi:hypothetical protein